MSSYGVNFGYVLVQCLTLVFLFAWPILSLVALFGMRGRKMDQIAQALWALVVLSIPIFGAVALWILQPGEAISLPVQPTSSQPEKETPLEG